MRPKRKVIPVWAAVLASLAAEPLTKWEITQELHLGYNTVDNAVLRMREEGLVEHLPGHRWALTLAGVDLCDQMRQTTRELLEVLNRGPRERRLPHRNDGPGPVDRA